MHPHIYKDDSTILMFDSIIYDFSPPETAFTSEADQNTFILPEAKLCKFLEIWFCCRIHICLPYVLVFHMEEKTEISEINIKYRV